MEVAVEGMPGRLVSADDGFTDFVRAHTTALLRTAYLLTGNSTAAEELVQDTLVRLYPKWHRVQAADVPLAYVRRSLANAFVNSTRRASSREVVLEIVPERLDSSGDSDAMNEVADRDALWAMLRVLPERQRAALVLRFFHDMPDDEIAAALDCRAGTVRSLISRGLSSMRDSIAADSPAPRRFT